MLLSDCPVGSLVTVTMADFDETTCFRLRELGLGCGACAKIIQRAPFGGRVLAVGGQRIAVDGMTTRHLTVDVTSAPTRAAAASHPLAATPA